LRCCSVRGRNRQNKSTNRQLTDTSLLFVVKRT